MIIMQRHGNLLLFNPGIYIYISNCSSSWYQYNEERRRSSSLVMVFFSLVCCCCCPRGDKNCHANFVFCHDAVLPIVSPGYPVLLVIMLTYIRLIILACHIAVWNIIGHCAASVLEYTVFVRGMRAKLTDVRG